MQNSGNNDPPRKKLFWYAITIVIALVVGLAIHELTSTSYDISCMTDKNAQQYGLSSVHPECK